MLRPLSKNPYDNCLALTQQGEEIFRCNRRRMDWYLRNDLAAVISEEPPVFQLKFAAKGRGHRGDPFFMQARQNRCVVCGIEEGLTLHHVLPHCYRRHFPRAYDRFGSYDVVVLCVDHHTAYETEAVARKRLLADAYNAPINGVGGMSCPVIRKVSGYGHALKSQGNRIPENKKLEMVAVLCDYFETDNFTEELLHQAVALKKQRVTTHGKLVVDQLAGDDEYNAFIIGWRQHFVDTMKPDYLAPHWVVDRKLSDNLD